ncbi:MAG: aldo/keto reductase, partial [Nevskiaceae bacterium]|nr:aldo/keto reductase [Nevskiaceae bacterium]
MSQQDFPGLSRRRVLQAGVAAGVSAALGSPLLQAAAANAQILRKIPASGEEVPVIGTGTNAFGVNDPAELDAIRGVLREIPGLGSKVVDTASGYGTSEDVIGKLLVELGNRDKIFLATKTPMRGDLSAPVAMIDQSFKRLQVTKIDLLQIHNFFGPKELLPHLAEYKAAG